MTLDALPRPDFWQNRRVLLTGHTGFKGSWLALWLRELGAEVLGVSLPDLPTTPSLWEQLHLSGIHEIRADITGTGWQDEVRTFEPEVVFHLAAQPLVVIGHQQPARTFDVNVGGTVAVLDLCASLVNVLATLIITTDKVYDPAQKMPHTEGDFFGGRDPYSASKAAAEIVVGAWPPFGPRGTARAGNVIGGGDWAAERLVPDIARGWLDGVAPVLRRPHGIRPWQHVLEPLRGYLIYAEMLASGRELPAGFNFGPADDESVSALELVRFAAAEWTRSGGVLPDPGWVESASEPDYGETAVLTLNSRLARQRLGWEGVLTWQEAVTMSLQWYRDLSAGHSAAELSTSQLRNYVSRVEAEDPIATAAEIATNNRIEASR